MASPSAIRIATEQYLRCIENGLVPRHQYDTFRGVYLGGVRPVEWGSPAQVEPTSRDRCATHNDKFAEKTDGAVPLAHHPGSEAVILKVGSTIPGTYGSCATPA